MWYSNETWEYLLIPELVVQITKPTPTMNEIVRRTLQLTLFRLSRRTPIVYIDAATKLRLNINHSGCQPKITVCRLGGGGNAKPKISSAAEFNDVTARLIGVECNATPTPIAIAMMLTSVAKKPTRFAFVVR